MDPRSVRNALGGAVTRVEEQLIYPDGTMRWIDLNRIPVLDKDGEIGGYLRLAIDVTERKLAERELRRSEAMLAEAQSTAKLGSWELDLTKDRLMWSDEVFRIFEIDKDRFPASYEAFLAAIHPDDRDMVDKAYTESLKTMMPYHIVHRLLMRDGRIKWVEEQCRNWYSEDGCAIRSVGAIQDITARVEADQQIRRSLAEKETLLREIHHRVKNNLQIISSLLYFQEQRISNPADLATIMEGRDRLHAMMLVHERLYQSQNLSGVNLVAYLRPLVQRLAETYGPIDGRISTRVEGDEAVALPIELATPCGLLASELVTNAFKHAFPGGAGGTVLVSIAGSGDRTTISVSDDGIGLPPDIETSGFASFGWQLIDSLVTQISGTMTISRGRGTTVTISFPNREFYS